MGRTPNSRNLPPGMRARIRQRKRGNPVVYYFYDTGGKPRREIPLGTDYVLAVKQWAELAAAKPPEKNKAYFSDLADRYLREVIPTKAANSQAANRSSLRRLSSFFGNPDAPLDKIEPLHIRQYLDWRKETPACANQEVNLFSAMWNQAREWGYTDRANPCAGVKRYPRRRREQYVEDHLYEAVYQAANQQIRDLMDLAYITGQRPVDVVNIHTSAISDGILQMTQQKTKHKISFEIVGLLAEIIERNRPEGSGYLFKNKIGRKLSRARLAEWFAALKQQLIKTRPELAEELEQFQFRDLRAKSGTDSYLQSGNIETARQQLGHTDSRMTRVYIRKHKAIKPLK